MLPTGGGILHDQAPVRRVNARRERTADRVDAVFASACRAEPATCIPIPSKASTPETNMTNESPSTPSPPARIGVMIDVPRSAPPKRLPTRRSPALLFLAARAFAPSVVEFIAMHLEPVQHSLAMPQRPGCARNLKGSSAHSSGGFRQGRYRCLGGDHAHDLVRPCFGRRHRISHCLIAKRDTLDANDVDIGHADEAQ